MLGQRDDLSLSMGEQLAGDERDRRLQVRNGVAARFWWDWKPQAGPSS